MTKFSLAILTVLDDNKAFSVSDSLSIKQILQLMPVKQQKSYSTMYRHLTELIKYSYVQYGLSDGLASTYYIKNSSKSLFDISK